MIKYPTAFHITDIPIVPIIFCCFLQFSAIPLAAQNDLAQTGQAVASSALEGNEAARAIDGKRETLWASGKDDEEPWLMVRLPGATELTRIQVIFGQELAPPQNFHLQYLLNGEWRNIKTVRDNGSHAADILLEKELLTDRIRLASGESQSMQVAVFGLFGQPYEDTSAMETKAVLVNQSGYNLHRTKRFTAPEIPDHTGFEIRQKNRQEVLYRGKVVEEKGDFTDFNPRSDKEYVIRVGDEESFPFRIGPYWLERVTYRLMLDFMIGARHYVGNVEEIRPLSFEWRDGDFFNWALQSFVALYLANPGAFERMEVTAPYRDNATFPETYKGLWGALEPYIEETPDIVRLIHWDADVKVSQRLDHEMQKAELAHFLYAWPYLKRWLPQQNFNRVYEYAREVWEKSTVSEHANSKYDQSPEHNLLALKTRLGTTKGEMPPGFSVIPNLMMYKVAQRENEADAHKYFQAAYRQMEWMIANLDWHDPMTTKGQRMSEHLTMRAFAYFHSQFPDQAPAGLVEKVTGWAGVALSRSDNMWDFRKYDDDDWVPPGWNETGNVLGFPAAALAAMSVLGDGDIKDKLEILVWSHMENAFGRNPTGRQFSYKGPEEVEGVDLGWYSRHKGGIGLLEELPFVFDGSPKSFHYPNHPGAGNLGWTEGWVQFNTAFNTSMAYLANYYTEISLEKKNTGQLTIRLKAPLNFHEDQTDSLAMNIRNMLGDSITVVLKEENPFSDTLTATVKIEDGGIKAEGQVLPLGKGGSIEASYGYGYFRKTATIVVE
ncbi:discoidin domain-containing protein [Negadavirga shengliensis]|uniref:Discoidin domain-containing protein n=1 Tax=Negadavirga shengliensis TaxID=1389218 RepID=A0ABV9SZJ1_9BACT